MGKYLLSVSVILCTIVLGMAIAQQKTNEQQKPDKGAPKAAKAQAGEVVSVDPAKNEIVFKDEAGTEIHILIGTSTKLTRDGKAITLADVKAGDKVTAECEESPDGCKATAVQVTTPPQGSN